MSLITRCPACGTMFKVVPDQLRISEGWVRCGQCEEIFDASAHLQEALNNLVASEQAEPEAPAPALASTELHVCADIEFEDDNEEAVLPSPLTELELSGKTSDESSQSRTEPVLEEFSESDEETPVSQRHLIEMDADLPAATEAPALMAARPPPPELSFMRNQKPASFWRRPLVRASLMLACLVLVAGIAVQVIVHERDRIVATEPGAKPWVLALCAVLNCSLSPLRQIESIVIDSSSFNKIRGDVYRLNFTLKNTALTGLAMPAIELALTDTQDQPVMRRVFLPAEFGIRSDVLAADSEATGSLALSVKTNGAMERIAGYRVLAFYP